MTWHLAVFTVACLVVAGLLCSMATRGFRKSKLVYEDAHFEQQDWRAERRARRRDELEEWDRKYRSLLPPKPPCTSDAHDHLEVHSLGGTLVTRICEPSAQADVYVEIGDRRER